MLRLCLQMKMWCDQNLVLADLILALGRELPLYQRPEIP